MRVLLLSRYSRLGASSRLRSLQYISALEGAGLQVTVKPLLGNDYIAGLYAGRRPIWSTLWAYVQRVFCLLVQARRFDVVWAEIELLPWLPLWMERLLIPRGTALVLDYDDAVFHRYNQHPSRWVRWLLGSKLDGLMRKATLVTAGNTYLAERARRAGCQWVEEVPTVVDLARYSEPHPATRLGETLTVGWIGSPSTAAYLHLVAPALAALQAIHPLRCVAIGARPDQVAGTVFEAIPWSEQTEVAELQKLDIGIMPLPDAPWERGKCGYKLIQYMALGLPVVASPVGVNRQIVQDGVNGFLASTPLEWKAALDKLLENAPQRRQMGAAGRQCVEQIYSLHVQAPRLIAMFEQIASKRPS